jgi:toxin HigB-1
MIESFKHKELRRFFEDGDRRDLNPDHVDKIRLILLTLHSADDIEVMNLPTFRLHPLTADLKGFWSVTVRANWRVIFRFEGGDAVDVDLTDYH